MSTNLVEPRADLPLASGSVLTYTVEQARQNLMRYVAFGFGACFLATVVGFIVASILGKILAICLAIIVGPVAVICWNKAALYQRYRLTLAPDFIEYQGAPEHWKVRRGDITSCTIDTKLVTPAETDKQIITGRTLVISTKNATHPEFDCELFFDPDSSFADWFAGLPGNIDEEYKRTVDYKKPDQFTGISTEELVNANHRLFSRVCKETALLFVVLFTFGYAANWYLAPSPEQLQATRVVAGQFDYFRGKRASSSSTIYTSHGYVPIYCGLGVFGSGLACGSGTYQHQQLIAQVTQYKSIFGEEDTVALLSTLDGKTIYRRTAQQLADEYQRTSRFEIKLYFGLACLFYFLSMLQFRDTMARPGKYY